MKRTLSEWLSVLPIKDAAKILEYAVENGNINYNGFNYLLGKLKEREQTLGSMMYGLFIFEDTIEGHDYWLEFIENNKNL